MKKLLSVLLALAMMFSICAFAAEGKGGAISLYDIIVKMNDQALLDLSGLGLSIEAFDGESTGLQLAVQANGQDALSLNMGLNEQALLLGMTGITDVYSVDLAALAEVAGIDAEAVADLDVEDITQQISPEDQEALAMLLVDVVALVDAGIVAGGSEEIEGTVYEVTNIDITAEQLDPIIQKAAAILDNYSYLLADYGIESFTQIYEVLQPALSLSGVIYKGETGGIIDFAVAGAIDTGSEEPASGVVNLYIEAAEASEDTVTTFVELSVGNDTEEYSLAFNLDFTDAVDGSWIPAAETTVDLLAALEDEAQMQQLTLQASSSLMTALSQMAAANETAAALVSEMMG